MAIVSTTKKEIIPSNTLAGKPILITKFKDGEVLIWNSAKRQWEAGAVTGEADLSGVYTKSEVDALIPAVPTTLASLSTDTNNQRVSEAEKSTWNAKANALGVDDNYVTDAEKIKIQQATIFTYNL